MGLTSAGLGLSGVVFSQINDIFFDDPDDNEDDTYGLLIFMAIAMASGMSLGALILGPLASPERESFKRGDDEEEQPLLGGQQRQPNEISGVAFFAHPVGFALFVVLFIVLGLGYVYLASIGQLLLALPSSSAPPQHLRNVHVSLFSIANCGARALFGTLSDILIARWRIHRLWVFLGATIGLLASLVYLVTAATTPESLVPCTIMVAMAYGTVFGVAPATTAEFGTSVSVNEPCLVFCISTKRIVLFPAQVFARNW